MIPHGLAKLIKEAVTSGRFKSEDYAGNDCGSYSGPTFKDMGVGDTITLISAPSHGPSRIECLEGKISLTVTDVIDVPVFCEDEPTDFLEPHFLIELDDQMSWLNDCGERDEKAWCDVESNLSGQYSISIIDGDWIAGTATRSDCGSIFLSMNTIKFIKV